MMNVRSTSPENCYFDKSQKPNIFINGQTIPDDIMLIVFQHLKYTDLLKNVQLVNKEWKQLVEFDDLWRFLLERDFSINQKIVPPTLPNLAIIYENTWKASYRIKSIGYDKIEIDNTVREGILKNQKLNGQGRMTLFNGDVFEGEFKDDNLNGKGKIIFENGEFCEGEFQEDRLTGKGKMTLPNGDVLEGIFKNSQLNGKGKINFLSEGKILEGDFKDNFLCGHGKITYLNGKVLEGEFKYDLLHGQGKITLPNGEVLEGEFENGRLVGLAQKTYPDGKFILTEFEDLFF